MSTKTLRHTSPASLNGSIFVNFVFLNVHYIKLNWSKYENFIVCVLYDEYERFMKANRRHVNEIEIGLVVDLNLVVVREILRIICYIHSVKAYEYVIMMS